MSRRLTYPNYEATAPLEMGGDILLRFVIPGSKFGPLEVILAAPDAIELLRSIDRAVDKSDAALATEEDAR